MIQFKRNRNTPTGDDIVITKTQLHTDLKKKAVISYNCLNISNNQKLNIEPTQNNMFKMLQCLIYTCKLMRKDFILLTKVLQHIRSTAKNQKNI